MTAKQATFLDWLKEGVQHGIITERKAKSLYETKYSKKPLEEFLSMLYSV